MVKFRVRIKSQTDGSKQYTTQNVIDESWYPSGHPAVSGSFAIVGEIDEIEYTVESFFDVSGNLVSGIAWLDKASGIKAEQYLYVYDDNYNLVSGITTIYESDGTTVYQTINETVLYDSEFNSTGARVETT